jgi:hypothetical protein
MSRNVIFVAALGVLSAAAMADAPTPSDATWRADLEAWKQKRLESVAGPDGWATLVARAWLRPGKNRFGSDPLGELVLPADRAPPYAGAIYLVGDQLRLAVAPGVSITIDGKPVTTITLADDRNGHPTMMKLGSLTMHVIKRQDRYALRAKDREHPIRKTFPGLTYYPLDPKLRVVAHLVPAPAGKTLPVVNILGQVEPTPTPGTLHFTLGNVGYTLDAVSEEGEDELFILFQDETAGHGTYPSGRFLYAPRPAADGSVVLDFNKAFNPPCAFTDFATCPLPPKENHLARKIEAGEKFTGHHHE